MTTENAGEHQNIEAGQGQQGGESQIAQELAALREQFKQTQAEAQHAKTFVDTIQKVVSGKTEEAPQKSEKDLFIDELLTRGPEVINEKVQQQLAQKAYFDNLRSGFEKDNPHLNLMKDEVFALTDNIVRTAQLQGQQVTHEQALKQARDYYDDKYKRLTSIGGASASPGGYGAMPESRYHGSETDYFAMTDADFKKVMDQKENERRSRNRSALSHYGYGR